MRSNILYTSRQRDERFISLKDTKIRPQTPRTFSVKVSLSDRFISSFFLFNIFRRIQEIITSFIKVIFENPLLLLGFIWLSYRILRSDTRQCYTMVISRNPKSTSSTSPTQIILARLFWRRRKRSTWSASTIYPSSASIVL